uniref:Uncharacterized protein n=1 Tax=Nelumbo nucifera TaxID=4432 RepID=A0A822XBM3_NELNU|nr:TPA_asm: hypothetical protein HUJ06_020267 [Nelumbo nucifera]
MEEVRERDLVPGPFPRDLVKNKREDRAGDVLEV